MFRPAEVPRWTTNTYRDVWYGPWVRSEVFVVDTDEVEGRGGTLVPGTKGGLRGKGGPKGSSVGPGRTGTRQAPTTITSVRRDGRVSPLTDDSKHMACRSHVEAQRPDVGHDDVLSSHLLHLDWRHHSQPDKEDPETQTNQRGRVGGDRGPLSPGSDQVRCPLSSILK